MPSLVAKLRRRGCRGRYRRGCALARSCAPGSTQELDQIPIPLGAAGALGWRGSVICAQGLIFSKGLAYGVGYQLPGLLDQAAARLDVRLKLGEFHQVALGKEVEEASSLLGRQI